MVRARYVAAAATVVLLATGCGGSTSSDGASSGAVPSVDAAARATLCATEQLGQQVLRSLGNLGSGTTTVGMAKSYINQIKVNVAAAGGTGQFDQQSLQAFQDAFAKLQADLQLAAQPDGATVTATDQLAADVDAVQQTWTVLFAPFC